MNPFKASLGAIENQQSFRTVDLSLNPEAGQLIVGKNAQLESGARVEGGGKPPGDFGMSWDVMLWIPEVNHS